MSYTIVKVTSATYPRTPSGRWSTVPLETPETFARTWQQHHRATDDEEARFFKARRAFRHCAAGVLCGRWVAPVAWGNSKRLVETAEPVCIPSSACGERERYVLDTATQVIYTHDASHELYTIYGVTQQDGHTPTCCWDATTQKFCA
jgi:hypothetical protein